MPDPIDTQQALRDQQRALELNAHALAPQAPQVQPGKASSLADVLAANQANWQVSTAGAGGALLVTSDQLTTNGAAVKVEADSTGKAGAVLSGAMTEFLKEAKGPAPFFAPRLAHLTTANGGMTPELSQGLIQRMDAMAPHAPENRGYILDRQKAKVGQMEEGYGVVVMEKAPGTQLNKLTPDEKVALIKSEAFAQQLGRAMPAAAALGLDDHFSARTGDSACKNNPSNLMYDPASGTLSIIDFSTAGQRISGDSTDLQYNNMSDQGADVAAVNTYISKCAADDELFDKTLDQLSQATVEDNGTLQNFMGNFVNGAHGDGMFPQDQYQRAIDPNETPVRPDDETLARLKASDEANKAAHARLTPEDKKRFAANVMKGTVDGLAHLKQNQPALVAAVAAVREGEGDKVVEHLVTQKQLEKLCTQLDKVNVDDLRQKVDARIAGMDHALDQKLAALTERADTLGTQIEALEKRVDKLQNQTSSRLRSKLPGHGGALNQAKDELAALKAQREPLVKEAHQAMSDADFAKNMRAQRANVQAQGQGEGARQAQAVGVQNRRPSVAEQMGLNHGPRGPAPQVPPRVGVNAPENNANDGVGRQPDESVPQQGQNQGPVAVPAQGRGKVGPLVQQFEALQQNAVPPRVATGKVGTVRDRTHLEKPSVRAPSVPPPGGGTRQSQK